MTNMNHADDSKPPSEFLETPCATCGHNGACHYNLRPRRGTFNHTPCHLMGKGDRRCSCKHFTPAVAS